MPAADVILEAHDLRVDLGGRTILHGLGLRLPAGQLVGLLGPNGSGKTTLLRTLAGLLPYTGTLTLDGRPIRDWPPPALARRLAFVRQALALSFDFTVAEVVLLGRAPHKAWLAGDTRHDHDLMRAALAEVDLSGFEARSMHALSGGEQQRVLLAQALVQQAGLLLLDEPTAHLDVHHQYRFMTHVQRLVRDGHTVLAAFHDLELAARYADTLFLIQDGRCVATGTPAEVLTPGRIATVFRMGADLQRDEAGILRIHYQAPIG